MCLGSAVDDKLIYSSNLVSNPSTHRLRLNRHCSTNCSTAIRFGVLSWRGIDIMRADLDGRATFLVHPEPGEPQFPAPQLDGAEGVIGRLGDHLRFTNGFAAAPPDMLPWFEVPGRASRGTRVIFGHWSAQGLVMQPDVVGLDTGCLWGRQLSALRLDDRRLFQVSCAEAQVPGRER